MLPFSHPHPRSAPQLTLVADEAVGGQQLQRVDLKEDAVEEQVVSRGPPLWVREEAAQDELLWAGGGGHPSAEAKLPSAPESQREASPEEQSACQACICTPQPLLPWATSGSLGGVGRMGGAKATSWASGQQHHYPPPLRSAQGGHKECWESRDSSEALIWQRKTLLAASCESGQD